MNTATDFRYVFAYGIEDESNKPYLIKLKIGKSVYIDYGNDPGYNLNFSQPTRLKTIIFADHLEGFHGDNYIFSKNYDIKNDSASKFSPIVHFNTDSWSPGEIEGFTNWIFVRKFASPEPTVLAGPVAEYHFDGNAQDSSGNGTMGR